ncbi:hypothetical protein VIBHAR_06548 [Vibrio campbellii ATCC BAA-1116]|uniref:Uncharacterized protein n=1 Tax=Vibrio campbellii (strain ATCC BAA-1116) TaxID=2902295 RepID=A7N4T6_VIBC1|nr:hypothetical protein VIBHAR_06548 [Vibrio campbellii ATCC BAA-1116]
MFFYLSFTQEWSISLISGGNYQHCTEINHRSSLTY